MNFPDINWNNYSASNSVSSTFCDTIYDLNLTQLVTKPTHVNGNILDVVLSNFDLSDGPTIIDKLPVGLSSDHYIICFSISALARTHILSTPKVFFDYSKADWNGMNLFFSSYNFIPIYQSNDIEFIWSHIKQVIYQALESFVPKFTTKQYQHPIWFNSKVRHELNRIHTMRRKCRIHPTTVNKKKLTVAENSLQQTMSKAKLEFESSLINDFAFSNNNRIFKYISSFSKSDLIPASMYYNDKCCSDNFGNAQMFNSYFYSIFTRETSSCSRDPDHSQSVYNLHTIEINPSEVFEALISLDPNKAMGIDKISPKILKYCATSLCEPITHLYSQCFHLGYLPQEWRTHCITPIYKNGDKSMVSNYLPISLLCIVSKALEKIIYKHTINFFSDLFTNHQFGFIPGHSSLQQLLLFVNDLIVAKENSYEVDTIYVDFKKAFDTVPHTTLLTKLRKYGITGNVFNFYQAYLSNRLQCVNINGVLSNFLPVLSGVPQGSLLGPLLFAVYVDDLPEIFQHTSPYMFADDTKCLKTIKAPVDYCLLQIDLDNLSDWSQSSDLPFNQNKFVHIHFWKTGTTSYDYYINGTKITTQESTKDLGIILSNNLDWSGHYRSITAKAYKILGLLRRCFKIDAIDAKRKLYISLVRSHLLYCSPIWRPHKIKDILLLEHVQRRATKYILNDYTSSYKSRLTKLNLLPLMCIYELHDLIFYIKSYKYPSSYFNINDFIFCSSVSTRSSSCRFQTST